MNSEQVHFGAELMQPNPLDFLNNLPNKRKTRSSMESYERELEIPSCRPPYIIALRNDSGRSRRFLDPISPQLSPCRGLDPSIKLDSLMAKDDFNQGLDFGCQRDRLSSDTCLSSSNWQSSYDQMLPAAELSFPLEPESLNNSHPLSDDVGMKDTTIDQENHDESRQEFQSCNLDLISHLKPIVVASNSVASTSCQAESADLEKAPSTSTKKLNKSAAAQMITHKVSRRKKSEEQVKYLRSLFFQLGGEWDGKVRKEAMQKTGLSRIQIYKWFFDMKLSQKPKEKIPAPEERVSYPPSAILTQAQDSFDASLVQPIFRVEKVARV